MDEIPDSPGSSLIDALAGQIVGLDVNQGDGRPGSTGSFTIRQPMSFDKTSNFNQPLIVIDDVVQVNAEGEPSMDAFNMLSSSEIESMTVLFMVRVHLRGLFLSRLNVVLWVLRKFRIRVRSTSLMP